jgi:hypothetical protein
MTSPDRDVAAFDARLRRALRDSLKGQEPSPGARDTLLRAAAASRSRPTDAAWSSIEQRIATRAHVGDERLTPGPGRAALLPPLTGWLLDSHLRKIRVTA